MSFCGACTCSPLGAQDLNEIGNIQAPQVPDSEAIPVPDAVSAGKPLVSDGSAARLWRNDDQQLGTEKQNLLKSLDEWGRQMDQHWLDQKQELRRLLDRWSRQPMEKPREKAFVHGLQSSGGFDLGTISVALQEEQQVEARQPSSKSYDGWCAPPMKEQQVEAKQPSDTSYDGWCAPPPRDLDSHVSYAVGPVSIGDATHSDTCFRPIFSETGTGERKFLRGLAFGARKLRERSKESSFPLSRRRQLLTTTTSQGFSVLCSTAIIINAAFIGWLSDYQMKHLGQPSPVWAAHLELGFCIWFAIEVTIRILAYRSKFFCGGESRWNIFDLALVLHGGFEIMVEMVNLDMHGMNSSFLRVLRLSRMLKLLRVIRLLRGFRELRLILNSIMGSAKSMLWSILLLLGVAYAFGVGFLQACTERIQSGSLTSAEVEEVRKHWGSIGTSMLSLFMANTGGEDWVVLSEPLWNISSVVFVFFLFYVLFFLFVVTNAVTSLMVEATISSSTQDQVMTIQYEMEQKERYITQLQDLFRSVDENQDGLISKDDFFQALGDPRMQAFVKSLGIDALDSVTFFKILTDNASIEIDLETFVVGCIKMRGVAKSIDVCGMHREHRQFMDHVRGQMDELERLMNKWSSDMDVATQASIRNAATLCL